VKITTLQPENVLSKSQSIARFDINTVMTSDLEHVKVRNICSLIAVIASVKRCVSCRVTSLS
jgi:hypothetical protein